MTDLQLIICAAVVAFAISAAFGIGVIFSVCEMLKQLDEETPEDQTPAALGKVDNKCHLCRYYGGQPELFVILCHGVNRRAKQ